MAENLLDHVRRLFRDEGLGAVWKWCLAANSAHGKAKRFAIAAEFARKHRNEAKEKDDDDAAKVWEKRRADYHAEEVKWAKKYRRRTKREEWPDDGEFSELLYHAPGPHLHAASRNRDFLIRVGRKVEEVFECRIGEFPPFDPVECVHVDPGSWHYRSSKNPDLRLGCSNRGDGLAFDANDLDGGNDDDYAAYLELRGRYG